MSQESPFEPVSFFPHFKNENELKYWGIRTRKLLPEYEEYLTLGLAEHLRKNMPRIEFPFDSIEGYLSAEDRVTLKTLSEKCSKLPGAYMEVGSYKGLSALCIGEGMPKEKTLYCFDWFEDEKLVEFIANIANAKFPWNIAHARGDFKHHLQKAGGDLPPIAFCFCDHSHLLDESIAVYDWVWHRLAVGGVLCFHDFGHHEWPETTEWLKTLPHKRIVENSIIAFEKE